MIAIVPHLWALRLPFALDDYNILPHLPSFLRLQWQGLGTAYFFRPTSWVVFGILIELGGGYASAPVFHAVMLLFHGLTAWLLFRVLRSFLSEQAAFAGAALFGLMPGGIQAVTWMAAAGDQMAVLFLLCAVLLAQRFARTGSLVAIVAIAVCTFLSFLAKETMVAFLPAAALGLWSVPKAERGERRAWIPLAAAGVGLAGGVVARWLAIGVLGPAYAYEVTLTAAELSRMHEPLFQLLAPFSQEPEFAAMIPKVGKHVAKFTDVGAVEGERLAVVAALGVAIVIGLGARLRTVPRAVLVLAAFVIAFLPTVATWHFEVEPTNTLSRAMYGPIAILCAFVAVCVDPILRPGAGAVRRLFRFAAIGALVVFALLQIDLVVHVARTELYVGDRVRSRLDSLEEIARLEGPDVHLIAVDGQAGIGGLPMLNIGSASALAPPFAKLEKDVTWWPDIKTLDRCRVVRKESKAIRVLTVRDHRFVPFGELLPAIPAELPPLRPVAGEPGGFELSAAVPMRAIAGLRFRARAKADGSPAPSCAWTGGGRTVTGPIVIPPGATEVSCLAVPPFLPDGTALAHLDSVRISGIDVLETPTIVRQLPEIEIRMPPALHTIVLGGLPEITFVVPSESPYYRIYFDFVVAAVRFPVVYYAPRDRLERIADRTYRFVPRQGDAVEWPGHPYHVTWHDLPTAFKRELGTRGLHAMGINFRVQGINADTVTPETESAWDTLTLLEE